MVACHCLYPYTPLQILADKKYLQGYLQACNLFIDKCIDAKSLQMADKMKKKTSMHARA